MSGRSRGFDDLLASVPAARDDGAELRASVREMRAATGAALGVIDDDPTGSQAVHDVQVVTVSDEEVCAAALGAADTCFVLTNSRSVDERAAVSLTAQAGRSLVAAAARHGRRIDLVSRSDSTLRGHVVAEVAALSAVRREETGRNPDAVLLVPAFIEAGRVTADDIHWARTDSDFVPVGDTEYARDPVFGYADSDLRDFIASRSAGAISARNVVSVSLTDVRLGGPGRVRDIIAGLRDGAWVVVNAVEYSDLEVVASAVLLAEQAGRSFLFRTGPSFVRALAGLEPMAPLRGPELASHPGRGDHGLIVVGSHVSQTSRQVADLIARGRTSNIELDVTSVIDGACDVEGTGRQVTGALRHSDILLYTSRAFVSGDGPDGLAAGRAVSAALARIVRRALGALPAWIIAKGGITSHDVAVAGLGMRRAQVAGQIFPGLISVFRPDDAVEAAMGMPYVVFPGNVGDDESLSVVADIMRSAGH